MVHSNKMKQLKLRRAKAVSRGIGVVIRVVVLVGLLAGLIWGQNNLILSRNYIFTSSRVPKTFVDYTITHVSDIHNSTLSIYSKVKLSKPDLILVTGGLSDDGGNFNKSIKLMSSLSDIAPVYFTLGESDIEHRDEILGSLPDGPILIEGDAVEIPAPSIDSEAFIYKYIGKRLVRGAASGDEDAAEYISYTEKKLKEDANSSVVISGISYDENSVGLVDKIYDIIGTDKSKFQISVTGNEKLFDTIKVADIDLVFSGGTHGIADSLSGRDKGIYSEMGTTLFLSGGTGNYGENSKRFFNFPEISCVRLSDGTIKKESPLEKLLGILIPKVGTKFDNDEGFREYTYTYVNGW